MTSSARALLWISPHKRNAELTQSAIYSNHYSKAEESTSRESSTVVPFTDGVGLDGAPHVSLGQFLDEKSLKPTEISLYFYFAAGTVHACKHLVADFPRQFPAELQ